MKKVKLNVYEEQRKWMEQHAKAEFIECDAKGTPVKAIYTSPMKQWEGLIAPDGTVDVPDMDYYNKLNDPKEILKTIKELDPSKTA